MQIVRLIYVSVMTGDCDTEALENILKVSRRKNAAQDITGVLCYDPSFFLQCLEGPRDAVNKLYTAINRDLRHKNVTLLEYADVQERIFGDWYMGFLPCGVLDKKILDKYATSGGKFNPFALNAKQAREFLLEVVNRKREHMKS